MSAEGSHDGRLQARTCYGLLLRLDGDERWLIWYAGDGEERDGVWVEPPGTVPSFPSQAAVSRFAEQRGITLHTEAPVLHDLDSVEAWLDDPCPDAVDCVELLGAWNLFSDVASSLGVDLHDRDAGSSAAYDELFWGNNLPDVTPAGRHYEPVREVDEIRAIRTVLAAGLRLFRQSVSELRE